MTDDVAIEVRGLRKEYHVGDEVVVALHRIDLRILRGGNLLYLRHLRLRQKYPAESIGGHGKTHPRRRKNRRRLDFRTG